MQEKDFCIEDAQVLLYLSKRSSDYSNAISKCLEYLEEWWSSSSSEALQYVLYFLQNSAPIAQEIFKIIGEQLKLSKSLNLNLQLLDSCASPAVIDMELINQLWFILGSSEDGEVVEKASRILVNLIQLRGSSHSSDVDFRCWWGYILMSLSKTLDKRFVLAGLKGWLACVCYLSGEDVVPAIVENSERYFEILQHHVSLASKFALQILERSLEITPEIKNDYMYYVPSSPEVRDAWSKYLSLVEILGVDASLHQAMDGLPDFVALLSKNSPIPSSWLISLINLGAINSNTEGIRTLVVQLILEARADQLSSLALHPKYTAQVFFPRLLQTSNFVVINDRCLHAEMLENFTKKFMKALISISLENFRTFVFHLGQYLLEHCHGFEAPRVLIFNAMLEVLPAGCLHLQETALLLAAARATKVTYTSIAMAELYLTKVSELVRKVGPLDQGSDSIDVADEAQLQLQHQSYLDRSLLHKLLDNSTDPKVLNLIDKWISCSPSDGEINSAESSLSVIWALQLARLNGRRLEQSTLKKLLVKDLTQPQAWTVAQRKVLCESVELVFEQLSSVEYDLCELAFATFSDTNTRLAALRCYKRQNPVNVNFECLESLWFHIKESTLRIIDRDLHHEFIDLLTDPTVVRIDHLVKQQKICFEIIELSVQKRNLLTPLAYGLQRFSGPVRSQILPVMVRIFSFIRSNEYTERLAEQVAIRFGVFQRYWGAPESQARGIAAAFLADRESIKTNSKGVQEATKLTLDLAKLDERVTGSFDNVKAHRRVLYYQILILIQDLWPHDQAIQIRNAVRESLETEANPPVRVHAEWLISLISITHMLPKSPEYDGVTLFTKNFVEFACESINELDVKRKITPRILGSLIRVAMLLYFSFDSMIKSSRNVTTTSEQLEQREMLGEALIGRLIPLATSNRAVLRHRAVSALYILNERGMVPQSVKTLVDRIASTSAAGVIGSEYQNEAYLWDPRDVSLGLVCGGVCSTVFDRSMPNTLEEEDFKLVQPDRNRTFLGSCWSEISRLKVSEPRMPEMLAHREAIIRESILKGSTDTFSSHTQTKSGTFDLDNKAKRTSLILVATLCDKAVNLGAICRLSDALGVGQLVIKDLEVLKDRHFISTSLTSERWIPLSQIDDSNLLQFLRMKRVEGYKLVGIEQTDTSKILKPNLCFPEKTLLIMGREKQGIPAEVLAVLDTCVEIEQLGSVRSMNIQTATAVVVHAYNQNHSSSVSQVQYQ